MYIYIDVSITIGSCLSVCIDIDIDMNSLMTCGVWKGGGGLIGVT